MKIVFPSQPRPIPKGVTPCPRTLHRPLMDLPSRGPLEAPATYLVPGLSQIWKPGGVLGNSTDLRLSGFAPPPLALEIGIITLLGLITATVIWRIVQHRTATAIRDPELLIDNKGFLSTIDKWDKVYIAIDPDEADGVTGKTDGRSALFFQGRNPAYHFYGHHRNPLIQFKLKSYSLDAEGKLCGRSESQGLKEGDLDVDLLLGKRNYRHSGNDSNPVVVLAYRVTTRLGLREVNGPNEAQERALADLMNDGRELRKEFSLRYPYAIDIHLKRGIGRLLGELSALLDSIVYDQIPMRIPLSILQEADDYFLLGGMVDPTETAIDFAKDKTVATLGLVYAQGDTREQIRIEGLAEIGPKHCDLVRALKKFCRHWNQAVKEYPQNLPGVLLEKRRQIAQHISPKQLRSLEAFIQEFGRELQRQPSSELAPEEIALAVGCYTRARIWVSEDGEFLDYRLAHTRNGKSAIDSADHRQTDTPFDLVVHHRGHLRWYEAMAETVPLKAQLAMHYWAVRSRLWRLEQENPLIAGFMTGQGVEILSLEIISCLLHALNEYRDSVDSNETSTCSLSLARKQNGDYWIVPSGTSTLFGSQPLDPITFKIAMKGLIPTITVENRGDSNDNEGLKDFLNAVARRATIYYEFHEIFDDIASQLIDV
jgi:hypothetical protein